MSVGVAFEFAFPIRGPHSGDEVLRSNAMRVGHGWGTYS